MADHPSRRDVACAATACATGLLGGCVTIGGDEPTCTHDAPRVAAIDIADGNWPMQGYDSANTAANPGAPSPDLDTADIAWSVDLPAAPTGAPLVHDGGVYLSTGSGFIALDAGGGDRRWVLGGPNEPDVLGHGLAGGTAFVGRFRPGTDEDDHVVAVDAATGDHRWRSATRSLPRNVAVTDREVVVGTVGPPGTTDGWVHSFAPSDGSERWRTHLDGDVGTRPVVTEDVVIVGTGDQQLVALDRSNGAPCWRVELAGYPWRAAVSNGRVYVGTTTPGEDWRRLEARDGTDGGLRWRTDDLRGTPTRWIDQFAVVDGTPLLSNQDRLYALANDGTPDWTWDRPGENANGRANRTLAVAGDVAITDAPGSLRAVDLAGGEPAGSLRLGATVAGLSVPGQSLFVATTGIDGTDRVMAVR